MSYDPIFDSYDDEETLVLTCKCKQCNARLKLSYRETRGIRESYEYECPKCNMVCGTVCADYAPSVWLLGEI